MEFENCKIQNSPDVERMHALIKQLGEALVKAEYYLDITPNYYDKALYAYNNYLRERGE